MKSSLLLEMTLYSSDCAIVFRLASGDYTTSVQESKSAPTGVAVKMKTRGLRESLQTYYHELQVYRENKSILRQTREVLEADVALEGG